MGRVAQLFATNPVISSGRMESPPVHKGETTIAVDTSGQHIVVGFNDPRGFLLDPISTDGCMVSDDGGATFIDGGTLSTPDGEALFGHPQVRYMGGSDFIYTSLMVRKLQDGTTQQTLCLFRSNDYGHTWDGPYDIAPATAAASNLDEAADAEFVAVDPETDRVLVTWTEFADPSGANNPTKICSTYSDDVLTGKPPTWSAGAVLNQGSSTFDSGTAAGFGRDGLCYLAWSESLPNSDLKNIALSVSTDKGATWTRPTDLRPSFFYGMDETQGCDTANSFPTIAVDRSGGLREGAIYVAYPDNSGKDGGDVVLQRSIDGGATFSAPISLSPRPGNDGTQGFPSITVDNITGKVFVSYLDQSSGHDGLTSEMVEWSENGGESWTPPTILGEPFNASFGSNASEPNLGEYSELTVVDGHAAGMVPTRPKTVGFDLAADRNRPALLDFSYRKLQEAAAPLQLLNVDTHAASGRESIEPGDTIQIYPTLEAFVTNLHMAPRVMSHIHGHLSTDTPGITITNTGADFPDVSAGGSSTPSQAFVIELSNDFDVNTPIQLELDIETAEGNISIPIKLMAGQLESQKLFDTSFRDPTKDGLPEGWSEFPLNGAQPAKWAVKQAERGSFLFHEANSNHTVNEAVVSPEITIPSGKGVTDIDFDLAYNTLNDPVQTRTALAGASLRLVDEDGNGQTYSADSLASGFTRTVQGRDYQGYPAKLPESSDYAMMQNVGVWGGTSKGTEHVHLTIPGISGNKIRLEWEFSGQSAAAENAATTTGPQPGVWISNLTVSYGMRRAFQPQTSVAKSTTYTLNQGTSIKSSLQELIHTIAGSCSGSSFAPDHEPAHGHLYLHDDGLFMYEPNTGFNGEDHFSYKYTDPVGKTTSAFVYFLVNPVIRSIICPTAIKSGGTASVTLTLTGSTPPDGLTVSLSTSNPSLAGVPSTVRFNRTSRTATFPVKCSLSAIGNRVTVKARLNGLDRAADFMVTPQSYPAAADHVFATYEGERFEALPECLFGGGLFRGAAEARSERVTNPSHGALDVEPDGSFAYRPTAGFYGEDSFKYRVTQGNRASDAATVRIEVLPTIHDLSFAKRTILSGSKATVTVLMSGLTPIRGESISLGSSNAGVLTVPSNVQIPAMTDHYILQLPTNQVDSPTNVVLTATVHGVSRSATILLTPHRNLVAFGSSFRVNQNDSLIQSAPGLLRGTNDPNPASDGNHDNGFQAIQVDAPKHGTVTIHEDGSFQYVPNLDFTGADSFTFKAVSEETESEPQTIQVMVEPVLSDFFLDEASVNGGADVNAAVTLSAPVKNGAMRVNIDCSQPALVDAPAAVMIENGQDVAKFRFKTHTVSSPTTVYIKVRLNGEEKDLMLVLQPSIS